MVGDRPIFSMGHFFKAVYADSWFAPREYFELFAQRQRLQIGVGDSNMCETAEYLRVGTTLLVLDAIEAGMFQTAPLVRRPIQVLHDVCGDESLTHAFVLRDGQAVTALQVQRYYVAGCRAFLNQQTDVPTEAWDLLHLWSQTLDHLAQRITDHEPAESLVGCIDWVTKKYLLDRAGENASWAERKKIDLRYHELSEDGYFAMLQSAGLAPRLIAEEAIERATRLAPPNSPATMRGHYIREFADGEEPVTANWKAVVIGHRWGATTIRLSKYGRASRPARGVAATGRSRRTTNPDNK
jgi:proteasome accessory factor A